MPVVFSENHWEHELAVDSSIFVVTLFSPEKDVKIHIAEPSSSEFSLIDTVAEPGGTFFGFIVCLRM